MIFTQDFVSFHPTGLEGPVLFLKRVIHLEVWLSQVEKIAQQACESQGCLLYDFDLIGSGKGRTLRLFIDKENGASIEDCSEVSKIVNDQLDEKDIIPGGMYHLEVSTPGIDRVLKQKWHFEKALGKKIHVKTKSPFQTYGVADKKWMNAKTIESELSDVIGEQIRFKVKDCEITIPLSEIDKAKVVFVFGKNK